MGLLARILTGKLAAKVIGRAIDKRAAARARASAGARAVPKAEYIPAAEVAARTQGRSAAVAGGAGRFYRQNARMVNTLGAAALALVLARLMQQRRRLY